MDAWDSPSAKCSVYHLDDNVGRLLDLWYWTIFDHYFVGLFEDHGFHCFSRHVEDEGLRIKSYSLNVHFENMNLSHRACGTSAQRSLQIISYAEALYRPI